MRENKGSNLVDYAMPTLLVGLVAGVAIYNLAANGDILNFIANSGNMLPNITDGTMVIQSPGTLNSIANGTVKAGQLGGSPTNPAKQCVGDVCSMDYGTYVLNGVPDNFNQFVETSGPAAGTDKILSLIDQIIEQADQLDPPMDETTLKELSNLGHQLAGYQKETETIAAKLGQTNFAPLEMSKLTQLIPKYGNSSLLHKQITDKLNSFNTQYPNPQNQTQKDLVNTINFLANDILSKNIEYSCMVNMTISVGMHEANSAMNPFTIPIMHGNNLESTAQMLLHPQYSKNTDIDSTIICVTGQNNDTGKKCY